jgi:signal transduction histidine kinase
MNMLASLLGPSYDNHRECVAAKQIILFSLIVCLPLAMLAWLGWRLARDEQGMARQRLTGLALERLEDVTLVATKHFQRCERELLELTELDSYDPDRLRQIVRSRPGIGQLFVLNPDGTLLHPDPAGTLNDSEREFLLHAKQTFDDKDLIRNGSADENDVVPTTHGWHVRYWGPGLNLVFYHRLESGKVVGVLVPRSRWIADLIAELPETAPPVGSRDGFASEARVRLVNSNGDVVYQWGAFEPDDTAKAFAELPLCNPLSSWRLEYFVDAERFAAVGRSAYWNLFSALAAIGLGLIVVAASFYREYAREMREAVQRVNFVNQVSHELKTPLTNIRMYAELLEADLERIDCEGVATPRSHLHVIVTESQRLSRLIGNVLTFARQRRNQLSLRKTTARVDEVIAAVIERFRPTFRQKGIEVVFDAAASAPVRVDADALEQILGNLISNVEKYAAAGGHMEIVSRQEDSQTSIVVADRGPGIPVGVRGKIFRPFYRVSDRTEGTTGTGIGLSIARKLARMHGGDVVLLPCESGTRFQIQLDTPKSGK